MRSLKLPAAVVFALLFSLTAFADIAPPKTPQPDKKTEAIDTYIDVKLDKNATEARLIIPASQIDQLRAELEGTELDRQSTSAFATTQTVVSGMLISFALILGGTWFVRTKGGGRAAAGALMLCAFGGMAAVVYGNVGPPAANRSITNRMFSKTVQAWSGGGGKIKLEVSNSVRNPTLIVPNLDEKKNNDEE